MHVLLRMHLLLIFYSMYMCVQEEEQMGVNQHVRDAVRKSDVYTQNVAEGPPIPRVEFEHLWRTTNGFDAEYAHPSAWPLPAASDCVHRAVFQARVQKFDENVHERW